MNSKIKGKILSGKSISIIIPTYNRVGMLKRVIDSYLKQAFVSEIIIVDDASTDTTSPFLEDLKKKHPMIRSLQNATNMGSHTSKNLGVMHCKGDFILIGEDDVCLANNYSAQLFECMQRTGASIVAGRGIYPFPGESFKEALERANKYNGEMISKRLFYGNWLKNTGRDIELPFVNSWSLIRREVFDKVNYDTGYKGNAYREETDFCINAQKQGFKVFFCPHTHCFHLPREVKSLGGQWSRGILVYKYWVLRNNLRFLKKHYPLLKEKLELKDSIWKLMLFQFFYELGRTFTYFLRKYFPWLYSFLAQKLNQS